MANEDIKTWKLKQQKINGFEDSFLRNKRVIYYPANNSMPNQRCFNVADQRWNYVDLTLKMKQNWTSEPRRRKNVASTLLKQYRNQSGYWI